MLTWEHVKEWCFENLELAKEVNDEINARCPFCGDSKKSKTKKRLWVKYEDGQGFFHCFNCSESGNFYRLYAQIACVSIEEARSKFESLGSVRQRLTKQPVAKIKENKEFKYFDILDDCFRENEEGYVASNAKRMLAAFRRERMIPNWVKLYYSFRGKYQNRIIIPIFNADGKVTYFQARRLPASSAGPKYKNPSAEKNIEFDLRDFKNPIILVEGLIDSFMLPGHGIPMLTASASDDLVNGLISKYDLVMAFDNDRAGYKGLIKFMEKNEHASFIRYFLMPEQYKNIGDLNELRVKFKDINIIKFVLENSYSYLKTQVFLKTDKWRTPDADN